MRLVYSNALSAGGEQRDPTKSLGGYISKSPIPNDILGNLLSSVSKLNKENKRFREHYLIVLENNLSNDVENISLWYNYPTEIIETVETNVSKINIELALVEPTIDDCGDFQFERLQSTQETPLYASFQTAVGEVNALDGGTLEAGKFLGIWVKKTLNTDNIESETCDEIYERFKNETELPDEQEIEFNISYDNVVV